MQLTGDWGSDGLTLDMGDVDLDALYLFTAWDGRGTRRTGAGRCQSRRRRRFVEDANRMRFTSCWGFVAANDGRGVVQLDALDVFPALDDRGMNRLGVRRECC